MFTFLILTYMHEKYILETLESIKYQIENYGQEKDFQIIISDDASTDKTIYYAEKWIENNKELFNLIDIVTFDENKGANVNYARGCNLIKGEQFKFIEGDDLFSCNNIFEVIDKLQEFDLIYSTVLPFKNNIIGKDKAKYDSIALKSVYTSRELEFLSKVSCPIGGASLFEKRTILTEEVIKLILNFKLVGDRPKVYKYFNNNNLKYKFEIKPLVLYRHSETSISQNINTVNNNIHNQDIIKLAQIINDNDKNLLIKYINFCNIKSFDNKLFRYVNPLIYYNKILKVVNYKKIKVVNSYLMSEIGKNQEYLDMIVKKAEYYKKINN